MSYSAKAVANYFLSKYGKHGITPLKIQKLVYIAHGWYMAFYEDPLIDDEWAEAWRYGPVFPSLYHEFKHRGRMPIKDPAHETDVDLNERIPKIKPQDERTPRLLDKVWEVYGGHTGIQLSDMCHRPGSPWDTTWNESGGRQNTNISDELIRDYYKALREKNRNRG